MRTTVALADDHQVVIDGFKAVLAGEPDLLIVGETNDGLAVRPMIERLRPAVLVLDLVMPGLNGLELLRLLREHAPWLRTVVLSMHAGEAYVSQALREGALGYVLKQAPARELIQAIRAAASGARHLSPPLSEERITEFELRSRRSNIDPLDTLSAREREVLQLAAEGLSSALIGRRLGIGRRTVETHRANLGRKLGFRGQTDLVRFAVGRGLVPSE